MENSKLLFIEDEDAYISHRHNFSALDYITRRPKTEQDLKNDELRKIVREYPFLFDGMYELLFKAAVRGDDLDQEYEKLKDLSAFL
jgi:hypothetical protein